MRWGVDNCENVLKCFLKSTNEKCACEPTTNENPPMGNVPECRDEYFEISKEMSSLYFGLDVFCQCEAREQESDQSPNS